ncbi:MAG: hypothetical protein E7D39_00410, partial [Bifidobacterium longum]|nr:hypothetical protein [Bifidobacterium longum]
CGCVFLSVENILPKKRSSLTPTTTQRRTHTHKNSNSAVNDDPHKILYIANICDFGTRLAIELAKG